MGTLGVRATGQMISFDSLGFDSHYSVQVDPEFPGDGDWRVPVHGFANDGSLREAFESRWGPPSILCVTSSTLTWVGTFAAGSLGGVSGVYGCPSPDDLLVLASGVAYLVHAKAPEAGAVIAADPVRQVSVSPEHGLLLLVRDLDITALSASRVAWRTGRLVVGDLHIEEVRPTRIVCRGDNLGGTETIELDPPTSEQIAGTRLADFCHPTPWRRPKRVPGFRQTRATGSGVTGADLGRSAFRATVPATRRGGA
jgi:hypothetical protein